MPRDAGGVAGLGRRSSIGSRRSADAAAALLLVAASAVIVSAAIVGAGVSNPPPATPRRIGRPPPPTVVRAPGPPSAPRGRPQAVPNRGVQQQQWPRNRRKLIWSEEFDRLDENLWEHLVTASRGFNDEFQYYRNDRRNSYVNNGVLYIQPTLTAAEYGDDFLYKGQLQYNNCNLKPCASASGKDIVTPIQSARIRTLGSFGFRYGRVEVRARMPRGDWIWPAIWMKPVENFYGGWPASGEIDIVEVRSNRKLTTASGVSQGIDRMGTTLHFGPNSSYNVWRLTHWERSLEDVGGDYSDGFHIYEMSWTEKKIEFFVDKTYLGGIDAPQGGFWKLGGFDENPGGKNIWENGGPMAPFDRQFFFVLNVAVGGRFFPDGWKNYPYPKPWNWTSPHPMQDFWEKRNWWLPTWDPVGSSMWVDYIRVYDS
ncbi:beta-1,3-glucan-binding protein-like [Ischnura elegans]|uniref:beta-1,3-glucan-binding protein-like n=1 Tax=Ischnura elegans TaxID=197161 RepID=UPI001ED86F3B|nr:beta-1,3-glucan-binding protein-like [Ischnura elegans]